MFLEPEDMDAGDVDPSASYAQKIKSARHRGEKGSRSCRILLQRFWSLRRVSHDDLLKLAKRSEMALDHQSGCGAASSKHGEKPFENDNHEDEGYTSMTSG